MSDFYNEFLPDFLDSLIQVLDTHDYVLKGGQAVKYHMHKMNRDIDARFSKDIDFSFSAVSFPIEYNTFKTQLIEKYNSIPDNKFGIKSKDITITKLPNSDKAYFGIRLSMAVRLNKNGKIVSEKAYFNDIESLYIIIDFSVNEVVDDYLTVKDNSGVKLAGIPLIISEKFRAICSQLEECINVEYKTPRPKDFFDIFLLNNICYGKKPSLKTIKLIRDALEKTFAIKGMDMSLLKKIDTDAVKSYHANAFQEQVLDTLNADSIYKEVTFDQVYSEAMLFLDLIVQ